MPIRFELVHVLPAPPARVWDALADVERRTEWQPAVARVERLDGGAGFERGSRWRATRRTNGREVSEILEVVDATRPARLTVRIPDGTGGSGMGERVSEFVLLPTDAGTLLTLRGQLRPGGWLRGLVTRLFLGAYRAMIRRDLRALGDWLARERAAEARSA